jgi:hypothetical protein
VQGRLSGVAEGFIDVIRGQLAEITMAAEANGNVQQVSEKGIGVREEPR